MAQRIVFSLNSNFLFYTTVGSQHALNAIQDMWLHWEKRYEVVDNVAGLTMDVAGAICDALEKAEEAASSMCIYTPLGCKEVAKAATIYCRNMELFMKYVWLGALIPLQNRYVEIVSPLLGTKKDF